MSTKVALEVSAPRNQQSPRYEIDGPSLYFRKRVYFTDFSKAATTADLDTQAVSGQTTGFPWVAFPAGLEIEGAGFYTVTLFSGGAVSAATLSVGTTGSATAYVAATNVFTGATVFACVGAAIVPFTFLHGTGVPAKSTVRVELVTTTANTSVLTAGKADIYLKLRAVSLRTT